MDLHVAQMTSHAAMRQCYQAVTMKPAGRPGQTVECRQGHEIFGMNQA